MVKMLVRYSFLVMDMSMTRGDGRHGLLEQFTITISSGFFELFILFLKVDIVEELISYRLSCMS